MLSKKYETVLSLPITKESNNKLTVISKKTGLAKSALARAILDAGLDELSKCKLIKMPIEIVLK